MQNLFHTIAKKDLSKLCLLGSLHSKRLHLKIKEIFYVASLETQNRIILFPAVAIYNPFSFLHSQTSVNDTLKAAITQSETITINHTA